ncbi:MAG: DUF547 domain-containing protein [Acidobacteria bacterium]|nr:DUF547 domain-containing protein [Acidobacteriota bacterium]
MSRSILSVIATVLAALIGSGELLGTGNADARELAAPGAMGRLYAAARPAASSPAEPAPRAASVAASAAVQRAADGPLDRILDLYVRDGFVYYRALRAERTVLDRYVRALREVPAGFDGWSTGRRIAFWLNAYNALVLRTVVDHYPIRGDFPLYPADSIRQIPGALDDIRHTVAGRELTLDAIESSALASLGDPRVFLALGRGAVGSGRLRSEAYSAARLEEQLAAVVEEFATEPWGVALDRLADTVRVSPIFGWRREAFIRAYADRGWTDSGRSPIERAVLNLIESSLFPSERAFLAQNTFSFDYQEFDWRLNDLTGGRP